MPGISWPSDTDPNVRVHCEFDSDGGSSHAYGPGFMIDWDVAAPRNVMNAVAHRAKNGGPFEGVPQDKLLFALTPFNAPAFTSHGYEIDWDIASIRDIVGAVNDHISRNRVVGITPRQTTAVMNVWDHGADLITERALGNQAEVDRLEAEKAKRREEAKRQLAEARARMAHFMGARKRELQDGDKL